MTLLNVGKYMLMEDFGKRGKPYLLKLYNLPVISCEIERERREQGWSSKGGGSCTKGGDEDEGVIFLVTFLCFL